MGHIAAPLLAAIASDPDDDLPRLVYADWLDEHGDGERAEFIRLQCHSARVGPLDPTWAPAKLREFDLFKANEAAWRPGKRNDTSFMLMARWRRGFPACVDLADVTDGRLTNGEWCNGGFHLTTDPHRPPHVWPAVGPVREVSFSGWTPGSGGILRHERLRTVRSITLMEWYAGVRPDDLENLAAELAHLPPSHFPELTALDLDQGELTLPAVEALAAAPALQTLKTLSLRYPERLPPEERAGWLVAAGRLFGTLAPRVEAVGLTSPPIDVLQMLADEDWPHLRALRIERAHADGLPLYARPFTPMLAALAVWEETSNPLPFQQVFNPTWPDFARLKVRSLGRVTGAEARGECEWMSRHPNCSLDFFSAHVLPDDHTPLRPAELHGFPATRHLKALSGQFANADLMPLSDPEVLPECHTIWSWDENPPKVLRWRGGLRTVIPKDSPKARRHAPTRSHWCGWHEPLLG